MASARARSASASSFAAFCLARFAADLLSVAPPLADDSPFAFAPSRLSRASRAALADCAARDASAAAAAAAAAFSREIFSSRSRVSFLRRASARASSFAFLAASSRALLRAFFSASIASSSAFLARSSARAARWRSSLSARRRSVAAAAAAATLASGVFFSRVIVAFARSHAAPASRIPVSRRLARSRSASGPGAPAPYGQPRIGRHDDGPGAPSAASAASESRHRVAAFSASVVTLDQCASESARSVSHSRAARSRFAYRLWPFVCVAERSKAAAAACASALHFADAEKSASATRHGRPQTTPLSED